MTRSAPERTVHLDVPTLALVLLHARAVLQEPVGLDVPAPVDPPAAGSADLDRAVLDDWDELWTRALTRRVTRDGASVPQWFDLEHPGISRGDAVIWVQAQRDRLVHGALDDTDPRTRARAEAARPAGIDRVAVLPLVAAYARRVDEVTLAVSAITFVDEDAWARAVASDPDGTRE